MEVWPSGAALQGEAPNHGRLLRSRAGVASDAGKGAPPVRQVRIKKANGIEPLMTCRKRRDDIKTEASRYLGMSLGGSLLTAQAVSGMKVARA